MNRAIPLVGLGVVLLVALAAGPFQGALMVDQTGKLLGPTNFFLINSNELNKAVRPSTGGSVSINGNPSGATNLAGTPRVRLAVTNETGYIDLESVPGSLITGTVSTSALPSEVVMDAEVGPVVQAAVNAAITNAPLSANQITSGELSDARIPAGVSWDSETAALYGALAGDNDWTGTQRFLGPVYLFQLDVGIINATNFVSQTWTNTGAFRANTNVTVGGGVSIEAGPLTVGGTNVMDRIEQVAAGASATNAMTVLQIGYPVLSGGVGASSTLYVPAQGQRQWSQVTTLASGGQVRLPFAATLVGMSWRTRVTPAASPGGGTTVWTVISNGVAVLPVLTNAFFDNTDLTTNVLLVGQQFPAEALFGVSFTTPAYTNAPAIAGYIDTYWRF